MENTLNKKIFPEICQSMKQFFFISTHLKILKSVIQQHNGPVIRKLKRTFVKNKDWYLNMHFLSGFKNQMELGCKAYVVYHDSH